MFAILFGICWQTENKTCLVYVFKHYSKVYVSRFKFKLTTEKKSQNLPSLIDRKLDSTDQESQKSESMEF